MEDISPTPPRLYRFGPFELDAQERKLSKRGTRIRLGDQPFMILRMLIDRPGSTVMREEIQQRLWPNDTVVEFDLSINAAVRQLRVALGDSAEKPRYVETVARRGYRFVADVEHSGVTEMVPAAEALDPQNLAGQTISHFRVIEKLGRGGMGVVYRAEDLQLGRQVALKFLPATLEELPDLVRRRFEREARALAALSHPHICAVLGLENIAGQPVIVMELVEGESLAVRLRRGPMTASEALPLIIQLAGAVAEAHRKGIVHRDLKPANIMLTAAGVKLLDFGLVKVENPDLADAGANTLAGTLLGTPHYMSPEQAQGRETDWRSDIFSMGVVLYESLSGRRAFDADTPAGVIAAILEREPPTLSGGSSGLQRVLARCLARNPEDRWQSAGDLKASLELLAEEPSGIAQPAAALPNPARMRAFGWAAAGVVVIILGLLLWREGPRFGGSSNGKPLLNFSMDLGPEAAPARLGSFALSPDGTRLAYSVRTPPALQGVAGLAPSEGGYFLAVREMSAPRGTILEGTEGSESPFFSPDGKWIGFFAGGKLKKIAFSGGKPIELCETPVPRGGSWGEDGRIILQAERAPLVSVSENGGTPRQVTNFDSGEKSHRWPQILPGGEVLLFSANNQVVNWENGTIAAWSLKTGQRKTLVRGGYYGRYVPGGYLVYGQQGKLMGMRFDPGTMETSGHAVELLPDLATIPAGGHGQFDLSKNGMFVYRSGKAYDDRYPIGWQASGGKVEPIPDVPRGRYTLHRLSPDGKRVALRNDDGTVFVWEIAGGAVKTLGNRPGGMVWMPDSKSLLFTKEKTIWKVGIDGGEEPVRLVEGGEPQAITSDGRRLVYADPGDDQRGTNLRIVSIDTSVPNQPKTGSPELLLHLDRGNGNSAISPDGHWLAYASREEGPSHIYVKPLRSGTGKWVVSRGSGGDFPRWSPAGQQLFFVEPQSLRPMVVSYSSTADTFSPGTPRRWSDTPIGVGGGGINFDVAPDGKRILAYPNSLEQGSANFHVTVLLNFFDEVKRRIP